MDKPVSDLVAAHSVCALVLERYQIDYCLEGQRTLLSACDKQHLDPGRILFQCDTAIRLRERRQAIDPHTLSTKQLLLTVIAQHHRYLRDTLPLLPALAERVAQRHGERQPVLRVIATTVTRLAGMIEEHVAEEERSVLPACAWENASFVRDMLPATHTEHDDIIASLHTLRKLCNDFTWDESACIEQRALFSELEHLERDTRRHVEIENDVLFRRFRG